MKNHRHSVRSNNRTTVQRFDIQEHSRQRNLQAKIGLDAHEAHGGPRARTIQGPQCSQILDAIPPDEYVQNWLTTTVRETNIQSATGPDTTVYNSWSFQAYILTFHIGVGYPMDT